MKPLSARILRSRRGVSKTWGKPDPSLGRRAANSRLIMSMYDDLPEWARRYSREYVDARVEERYRKGMTEQEFLDALKGPSTLPPAHLRKVNPPEEDA